jgi:hypothetical protein
MKKIEAADIPSVFLRTLYLWSEVKEPTNSASEFDKIAYYFKIIIAYLFWKIIGPNYHKFIPWITRYYPFSLLYRGSLLHADAVKAKNLMRGMEASAENIGIPVDINSGQLGRGFSIFYGKLEKKGLNKKNALQKLQDLFQDKYGTVYVQEESTGFRILIDSNLVT